MTILFADNPDNSLKRKKRKVEYEKYQRTRGSVEVCVMNFKSCLCAAEQNVKLSETKEKKMFEGDTRLFYLDLGYKV
jgi:hypothetical protein